MGLRKSGHLELGLGIGHNLHIFHLVVDAGRWGRKDRSHNIFDPLKGTNSLGNNHTGRYSRASGLKDK